MFRYVSNFLRYHEVHIFYQVVLVRFSSVSYVLVVIDSILLLIYFVIYYMLEGGSKEYTGKASGYLIRCNVINFCIFF